MPIILTPAPHPTTMHCCCLPHPLSHPMHAPAPVMSSNGETNTVLRGVTHGAVDFLIKPVRLEELRNMWQHVVRRRRDLVRQQCPLCTLTAHEQGASRRDLRKKAFFKELLSRVCNRHPGPCGCLDLVLDVHRS